MITEANAQLNLGLAAVSQATPSAEGVACVISYNLSRLRNKVIHLRTLFILKLIAQYAYYSGFMLSQKHPPRPDRHIHAF